LTARLREALPQSVPRAIVIRVNPGTVAADHWVKDPVIGGGRLIGELCHFLDLASAFAEGRPLRVSAEAISSFESSLLNDTVAVNVSFACGSIASIQYLGNGNAQVPKERVEVFCGESIGIIDDFRTLEITHGSRRRSRTRGRRQQKGHREEMLAFAELVATKADDPTLSSTDGFWSSALTLQVMTALSVGTPVHVDLPATLGGTGLGAGSIAVSGKRSPRVETDEPPSFGAGPPGAAT
jgi:predicted dehydrogenase